MNIAHPAPMPDPHDSVGHLATLRAEPEDTRRALRTLSLENAVLRERAGWFEQLTDNVDEALFLLSAAMDQAVYVSPAYATIWGRSCDSLIAEPSSWIEAFSAEDRRPIERALAELRTGRSVAPLDCRLARPDGTTRIVRVRLFPICNEARGPYRFAGMVQDITARKQAEEEIEQFFDRSSDMLAIVDFDLTVKRGNPSWHHTLGFSREQFAGATPLSFIHPDDAAAAEAACRDLLAGADRIVTENRHRCADGTYRWLQWTVTANREHRLLYAVARDVTERKLLEQQLAETVQLKEQFLANMSHELRGPLAVLMGHAGNLLNGFTRLDDARRIAILRVIREQIGLLDTLVDRVLYLTRLDAGRGRQHRGPVDLGALLEGVLKGQALLLRDKGQRVTRDGCASLSVVGDEEQLRQVISNLLNNASKYTARNGAVSCELQLAEAAPKRGTAPWPGWPGSADLPAGRWAALRVVDTGEGIEPEHLSHIFERFYRANPQGPIAGTGLGLAIVREIILAHGGHIAVASKPGQGSVFAIYLPIEGAQTNEP